MKTLITLLFLTLALAFAQTDYLQGLPDATPDLSSFPVTVTNCGRKLTFDAPPERVIGLWQTSNELLLALGVGDRMAAFAGFYTDSLPEFQETLNKIPSIGASTQWPSKEVMLTEEPDLVVSEGLSGFAYDPSQGYATVEDLEAAGAQVISTGSSCETLNTGKQSIEKVYEDLQMLGTIFGVSKRAEALVANLRKKENAVKEAVAGLEPKDVAYYNGGEGPLIVLGVGTWRDAIEVAGGTSVMPEGSFEMSREAFAAAQPEVILIGSFLGQDAAPLKAFLTETFPNVPAVQNAQLYEVPTIWTEASIRIMDGLEMIARAVHPEAFGE